MCILITLGCKLKLIEAESPTQEKARVVGMLKERHGLETSMKLPSDIHVREGLWLKEYKILIECQYDESKLSSIFYSPKPHMHSIYVHMFLLKIFIIKLLMWNLVVLLYKKILILMSMSIEYMFANARLQFHS